MSQKNKFDQRIEGAWNSLKSTVSTSKYLRPVAILACIAGFIIAATSFYIFMDLQMEAMDRPSTILRGGGPYSLSYFERLYYVDDNYWIYPLVMILSLISAEFFRRLTIKKSSSESYHHSYDLDEEELRRLRNRY